jgi:hypothetical protein
VGTDGHRYRPTRKQPQRSTHIKIAIIGAGNVGRTPLWIHLALRRGFGTNFAFGLLRGQS